MPAYTNAMNDERDKRMTTKYQQQVITISRGVETNDPAMADALRRWLVATSGDGGEVAREIFKQARAERRERRINR